MRERHQSFPNVAFPCSDLIGQTSLHGAVRAPQETKMSVESAGLGAWIGRSETTHDVAGRTPVAALTATLDHPPSEMPPGTALPPLWHWLYFLPIHRQSEIGA